MVYKDGCPYNLDLQFITFEHRHTKSLSYQEKATPQISKQLFFSWHVAFIQIHENLTNNQPEAVRNFFGWDDLLYAYIPTINILDPTCNWSCNWSVGGPTKNLYILNAEMVPMTVLGGIFHNQWDYYGLP